MLSLMALLTVLVGNATNFVKKVEPYGYLSVWMSLCAHPVL